MSRLGVLADSLATALSVTHAFAENGHTATIILDGATLPGTGAVIVQASVAAALRLQQAGCSQFLFAIDPAAVVQAIPLADQLLAALGVAFAPLCLALPGAGFTVYQGHQFQGHTLLHGAEPSAVRLLALHSDGTGALVPHGVVVQGAGAIRRALAAVRDQGRRYAVLDALDTASMSAIATAGADAPVLIGTAALVPGLAAPVPDGTADIRPAMGPAVILAGATTRATLFQAALAREQLSHYALQPGSDGADALAWAVGQLTTRPILICGPPALPAAAEPAAALAVVAAGLLRAGIHCLVVTGTATAEAVLASLAVTSLAATPGSCWLRATCPGREILIAFPDGSGGRTALLDLVERSP